MAETAQTMTEFTYAPGEQDLAEATDSARA